MADAITATQITALTKKSAISATDLVPVGDSGTATLKSVSWQNITAFDLTADSTFVSTWEALLK